MLKYYVDKRIKIQYFSCSDKKFNGEQFWKYQTEQNQAWSIISDFILFNKSSRTNYQMVFEIARNWFCWNKLE